MRYTIAARQSGPELGRCLAVVVVLTTMNFALLAQAQQATPPAITRLPPVEGEHRGSAAAGNLLTLEAATAIALAHNRELDARRLEAAAADDQLSAIASKNAAKVSLFADYSIRTDELALRTRGVLQSLGEIPYTEKSSGFFGGSAIVPLYLGTTAPEKHASQRELAIAQLQVQLASRELRLLVAQSYVDLLESESRVELAGMELAYWEKAQQDAARTCSQGAQSNVELLRLTAAREHAIHAHHVARVAEDTARSTLNRWLGWPLDRQIRLVSLEATVQMPGLEQLTMAGESLREDLGMLRALAERARIQADVVRARGLPQVFLHGEAGVQDNYFASPSALAMLGVSCDWNLVDGGQRAHSAAALDKQASAAWRRWSAARADVLTEIRSAYLAWQSSGARITAANASLAHQTERLRNARNAAAQGMATGTELLEAERSAWTAQHEHRLAVLDSVLLAYRLWFASGH